MYVCKFYTYIYIVVWIKFEEKYEKNKVYKYRISIAIFKLFV